MRSLSALLLSVSVLRVALNADEIPVRGVHAYAQKSIAPGQSIKFRVSADRPYDFSVVRLGENLDDTSRDITLHRESSPPRPQVVNMGSHVVISDPVKLRDDFSLETWVRPFNVEGKLIDDWLSIEEGQIRFLSLLSNSKLDLQQWYHIIVTREDGNCSLWVNGKREAYSELVDSVSVRIRRIGYGFDGDIARTTICSQPLDAPKRFQGRALSPVASNRLIAHWAFDEESGQRVRDTGPNGHHGQIVNHGTWMIGGPSFAADSVGRFDESYDPNEDLDRGHSLRLATDDLYDCRWPVAHTFRLPKQSKQGIYVGRFKFDDKQYNCSFVVRRPREQKPRSILVLCATNTWMAYGRIPFADNHAEGLMNWGRSEEVSLCRSNPRLPKFNMYLAHRHGQPTFQVGVNIPWPVAGPYKTYRGSKIFSQWTRNERFLHLWLDQNGYTYDVITDLDLDRHPDYLKGYEAVIVAGHSEYWSSQAYDAVLEYLNGGGDLAVLSANSVFWRVSFNEDHTIMECRKYPEGMLGGAPTQVGHLYHTDDGKRGGLMRFCGKPAWKLIGLETAGWCSGMDFGHYTLEKPEHFLLNTPHRIELAKGDAFGFIEDGLGCVGHEYDARLSTLLSASFAPPNLVEPSGIVSLAKCYSDNRIIDYVANENMERDNPTKVISEVIYWEREPGGRVFNIGSVAAPLGVFNDKNMGLLIKNVLHHFGAPPDAPQTSY
ncbi:MAG TPA: hypothetical protein DDW52_28660 [Planctomycetaceae bacterium]|nr:hypothetical protein [Planctomycetaceae bacterium]